MQAIRSKNDFQKLEEQKRNQERVGKKELDIKHLNNRNVIADEITNIQLDIIDRLKAENNELRAEIEKLRTENLTQGFECVGVSAI